MYIAETTSVALISRWIHFCFAIIAHILRRVSFSAKFRVPFVILLLQFARFVFDAIVRRGIAFMSLRFSSRMRKVFHNRDRIHRNSSSPRSSSILASIQNRSGNQSGKGGRTRCRFIHDILSRIDRFRRENPVRVCAFLRVLYFARFSPTFLLIFLLLLFVIIGIEKRGGSFSRTFRQVLLQNKGVRIYLCLEP